jgi:transposase
VGHVLDHVRSGAIVLHRDLATIFHDLAGRLHLLVRFDYLACLLHDATSNTLRLHFLNPFRPWLVMLCR